MYSLGRMGICFSEPPLPPVQQTTVMRTYTNCKQCGGWVKQANLEGTATSSSCEVCLQKNAMKTISPSAPPMYPPQQQYQYQQYPMQNNYTYAVQYPQQQTYIPYQQQPIAYISTPYQQQYRPPQQQMGTATAVGAGFLAGMLAESMLDPTD